MNNSVYIRPLAVEDALTSYKWRNNPKIWRLTGSRPNRLITAEIETEWVIKVLNRPDEKRFAICCAETDVYIGNVFLTDMNETSAFIHIFIGDISYWGGGRAVTAVMKLLEYSFEELGLIEIFSEINKLNTASRALAKATGFRFLEESYNQKLGMDLLKYVYTKEMFYQLNIRKEVTR